MTQELIGIFEQRGAMACRIAHCQGRDIAENPYLPGSEQHLGWEQERHRIELEKAA